MEVGCDGQSRRVCVHGLVDARLPPRRGKNTNNRAPAHLEDATAIFSRSRAGLLSDPCNLDPVYLAILVKVAFNKKASKPPVSAIKDKYYEMFRGKGKLEQHLEQEIMETAPAPAAAVAAAEAGPSSAVVPEV